MKLSTILILLLAVAFLLGLTMIRQVGRSGSLDADPRFYGAEEFESIESRVAANLVFIAADRAKLLLRKASVSDAARVYEEVCGALDAAPLTARKGTDGAFNRALRGMVKNSLAALQLEARRPEEALATAREAFRTDGEPEVCARSRYLAGRALDAMGSRREALEEYRAARALVRKAARLLGSVTMEELTFNTGSRRAGESRRIRLIALFGLWHHPLDSRYYWGCWQPGSPEKILEREDATIRSACAHPSPEKILEREDAAIRSAGAGLALPPRRQRAPRTTPVLLGKMPT